MRCELTMDQIEEDPDSEETTDLSWLLYETALTASGFQVSINHQPPITLSLESRQIDCYCYIVTSLEGRKTIVDAPSSMMIDRSIDHL